MQTVNNKAIHVTVSYTVNLGNYESAKVEIGTSLPLGDEDSAEQTRRALFERLKDEVLEYGEDLRADVPRYKRHRS